MNEKLAALNVREEFVPESRAVRSPLDQSRDVRHDKAVRSVQIHHTENRGKRCEVIVGNLRLRVADHGQKRGFPDIGESDQSDVRNDLQLQRDRKRS